MKAAFDVSPPPPPSAAVWASAAAGALDLPPLNPLGAAELFDGVIDELNEPVDDLIPEPPAVRLRAKARVETVARLYCTKYVPLGFGEVGSSGFGAGFGICTPVCTSCEYSTTRPSEPAFMKPFGSGPFVAPTSFTVNPAFWSALVSAPLLPSGCTPLSSIVTGWPRTFAPWTVVEDVPTASPSTVKCTSAIDVIESMVINPPMNRTPLRRDSACDTSALLSKKFCVVAWIEPTVNNAVSSEPPLASLIDLATSAGSGSPPLEAPGSGAIRNPLIVESVDDVPCSLSICARAAPPSPLTWLLGEPNASEPSVLLSGEKPSACAMNGHLALVHASKIGCSAALGKKPDATGQPAAGPCVAPLPGSTTVALAAGPFDELIDDLPVTNRMWVASGIGVRPPC